MAHQSGLVEQDMANSLSIWLAGSGTATLNYWLNYKNGVSYQVVAQTPQYRVSSMDELGRTPIWEGSKGVPQLLSNLATITRTTTPLSLNHYDVQPVFDVFANVQDTDLGTVADAVDRIVASFRQQISRASTITVRGQVQSMRQSFLQMGFGIGFAVLLVYFRNRSGCWASRSGPGWRVRSP
jgi:multidrug efflux pump subunit AcrB